MYAIINKNTKQFVYGTDYRQRYNNSTAKQRTSENCALTYESGEEAETDMKHRYMSKKYTVVEIEVKVKV